MTNEKYINADTVKLDIRRYLMPNVDDDGTVTVENAERYFLNLLDNAPAADVVEVIHAKWIWKELYGEVGYMLVCSECEESEGACIRFDYCPSCGAKMDLID